MSKEGESDDDGDGACTWLAELRGGKTVDAGADSGDDATTVEAEGTAGDAGIERECSVGEGGFTVAIVVGFGVATGAGVETGGATGAGAEIGAAAVGVDGTGCCCSRCCCCC